jgi:hypothetical protein
LVYAGDHIQLQSVKFPHLRLGVSNNDHGMSTLKTHDSSDGSPYHSFQELSTISNSHIQGLPRFLRPPACLAHRATCEVNASMELYRSFSVRLYFRQSSFKNVLYSGAYFRLFHPEANGK